MKIADLRVCRSLLLHAVAVLVFGALAGCASSPGTVQPLEPVGPEAALGSYDRLVIEVASAASVGVMPHEISRIELLLESEIAARDPTRFRDILLPSAGEIDPTATAPRSIPAIHAEVVVTRYDRGDAAQRAIMAGLGQIRIEGVVNLTDWMSGESLGRYRIEKSFAGGGFYGASTGVEDVEYGFAKSVADVILQPGEVPAGS